MKSESEIPIEGSPVPITCEKCHKKFEGTIPRCEFIEMETVTMLAWAHPRPEVCPYCGQSHQIKIIRLKDFVMAWVAVKGRNDPVVVEPSKIM